MLVAALFFLISCFAACVSFRAEGPRTSHQLCAGCARLLKTCSVWPVAWHQRQRELWSPCQLYSSVCLFLLVRRRRLLAMMREGRSFSSPDCTVVTDLFCGSSPLYHWIYSYRGSICPCCPTSQLLLLILILYVMIVHVQYDPTIVFPFAINNSRVMARTIPDQ